LDTDELIDAEMLGEALGDEDFEDDTLGEALALDDTEADALAAMYSTTSLGLYAEVTSLL
jgi:hypothetical protein